MLRGTASIALSILFAAAVLADTLHVPGEYPTIKSAVDASQDGDTVLVAPGTYYEASIGVNDHTVHIKSSDGPYVTVVDGGSGWTVFYFSGWDANDSTLEGFTITNSGNPDKNGGGVSCSDCGVVIHKNIITGNQCLKSGGYGAGIDCSNASPIITDNIISFNSAYHGGGISCSGADCYAQIKNNQIYGNFSDHDGGGIIVRHDAKPVIHINLIAENHAFHGGGLYCEDSAPSLMRNEFANNTAESTGGGIYGDYAGFEVINNFIHGNMAERGGGIYMYYCQTTWAPKDPIFLHNTIFNNFASDSGGGLVCNASDPDFTNTIFWDNHAAIGQEIYVYHPQTHMEIQYCDVENYPASVWVDSGTLVWGAGIIDANPRFVNAAGGDYHIRFDSPCKDAGINSAPGMPGFDFEGDDRRAYGTADMGADEFAVHLYNEGDRTPGGEIWAGLVGLPSASPVGLFLGSGVLDPPLPTPWGAFHLAEPWMLIPLVPIPSTGVLVIPATLPMSPPAPYDVPLQALIGDELTNLSLLKVQ
jgi:hypothetical protein